MSCTAERNRAESRRRLPGWNDHDEGQHTEDILGPDILLRLLHLASDHDGTCSRFLPDINTYFSISVSVSSPATIALANTSTSISTTAGGGATEARERSSRQHEYEAVSRSIGDACRVDTRVSAEVVPEEVSSRSCPIHHYRRPFLQYLSARKRLKRLRPFLPVISFEMLVSPRSGLQTHPKVPAFVVVCILDLFCISDFEG